MNANEIFELAEKQASVYHSALKLFKSTPQGLEVYEKFKENGLSDLEIAEFVVFCIVTED